MPLLDFWKSSPETVKQLSIEQVVANAGDGLLKDGSPCSVELREYLSRIPSEKIAAYIDHCLSSSFQKGGMVLQDLVNELGRRLEYRTTNGRYQGATNAIGFDGIWLSPESHNIVVEVKTTDAYRISLDTIVEYRSKLSASGQIGSKSSILIVVGREDTGELEAQIRGSRHAWDIRLISADALIKLVQIKENTEGTDTGLKIRSLLEPMEYTRLDRMIDVMFTTARDVESVAKDGGVETEVEKQEEEQSSDSEQKEKGVWQFTDASILQEKRAKILVAVSRSLDVALVKKSRAQFWDTSHEERVICTISKRYETRGSHPYWYAYHPQWHDFLSAGRRGFLALGCVDVDFAFLVPVATMGTILEYLNTTTKEDGQVYWHLHVAERSSDTYQLLLPKKSSDLDLSSFRISA